MGNWNQGSSGLSDEDMDQSLQQDIAAANFAASGGDLGGYTFGGNFVNDADNPDYTGTSTNMNQAVADMQGLFNTQRGITASNPYGKEGFFSRVLGIDPSKIDYSDNISKAARLSIANNQFSKYMNPQNVKGQIGYNPAYDTAEKGKLRAGVQDAGYQTVYGPVMEQARKQGIGEMLARGAMGLFGGLPGMALGQIGTQEYGLPGVDGFDSFDPNNPRAGGGILGSMMLGGLNTSQAAAQAAQAVDSLRARFSPTLAPTTNAGIASLTPASYETRADIRNRLSSTNPTMVSAPSSSLNARPQYDVSVPPSLSGRTLANGVTMTPMSNGMNEITMPDGRKTTQNADGTINSFSSYDMYAGEQLAGLLGENPKASGFRALGENIESIINKENLPDNQNMYGPGTPDLNDILKMYGMETVG